MSYAVKEIFYSLQGEGRYAGRPAVFCRFAGCNLWSGREADRTLAACGFCDTDFVGGEHHPTPQALVKAIEAAWPGHALEPSPRAFVVLTGGEPALQVDQRLIAGLRSRGFEIAIETNGTKPIPTGIHHICVSPKAGGQLVITSGDDLKLVYPQHGAEPPLFEGLAFSRFYLSPMDGPLVEEHTHSAARYCLSHPRWMLSTQAHKTWGLP